MPQYTADEALALYYRSPRVWVEENMAKDSERLHTAMHRLNLPSPEPERGPFPQRFRVADGALDGTLLVLFDTGGRTWLVYSSPGHDDEIRLHTETVQDAAERGFRS